MRRSLKAFSTPEMLVVIAIGAVLMMLAVPVYQAFHQKGKDTQCISNLRQCGLSVLSHANDHNGNSVVAYIPPGEEYDGHPQAGKMWHMFLHEKGYIRDMRIMVCPAFAPHRWTGTTKVSQTYGLRRNMGEIRYQPVLKIGRSDRLSTHVLLADSSKTGTWVGQDYYLELEASGSKSDRIHTRHGHRANIFFADGSLRALTAEEIVDLEDGWGLKRSIDTVIY
ncbi:MAG TPA: prepilin-type N-terminal cleavage/methylation domain-containing protein [Chthoniobacteraceae bacterium]|nr:prepilin-type N-terminal cleavage/methylation domain-containing protein [Chthoniobacteraceae bacterium]